MNGVLTFGLLFALTAALVPAGVHLGFRARRVREAGTPAGYGFTFEKVRIPTVRGRHLFGWLLTTPGAVRTVVMLHGWGSNAEQMLPIAAPLRRAGLNVLLLDARNHGQSDSDTFSSLPRFAEDLGQAIGWLKRHQPVRARQIAVLGHSVGAGAALFEATRNPDIAAVISIGAFAHPAEVTQRTLRRLRLPRFVTFLVIRYVEWVIGRRFEAIAPVNTVCWITCPVLLVHGREDQTVPVEDARRIAARCRAPNVRLLEIAGAGHDSTDQIERHAGELLRFLDDSWAARASEGPRARV
jgi:pimeloyl-ACP methyl ester carboxylesterase